VSPKTRIDVSPKGHVLESVAARTWNHRGALAEWIDNALDAGATNISVEFGGAKGRKGSYPQLPKIELFARDVRPGWASWGNEL